MMEQFVARMPRHAVPLAEDEPTVARPARAAAMIAVLGVSLASWIALGHLAGLI